MLNTWNDFFSKPILIIIRLSMSLLTHLSCNFACDMSGHLTRLLLLLLRIPTVIYIGSAVLKRVSCIQLDRAYDWCKDALLELRRLTCDDSLWHISSFRLSKFCRPPISSLRKFCFSCRHSSSLLRLVDPAELIHDAVCTEHSWSPCSCARLRSAKVTQNCETHRVISFLAALTYSFVDLFCLVLRAQDTVISKGWSIFASSPSPWLF